MNKRADHGSLSQRIARTRGEDPAPAAAAPSSAIKHCWVTTSAGRQPGLLLEWRRRPDGWHARVVHPVPDGGGWVVVEEWLPTALLEPVLAQR